MEFKYERPLEAPPRDQGVKKEILNESQRLSNWLEVILNRRINTSNIDTFAKQIIEELIKLTEHVLNIYAKSTNKEVVRSRDFEDEAFEFFGLRNINETLELAQSKDITIAQVNEFISDNIRQLDEVIIPPDRVERELHPGSGSFEEKSLIPRVKTLLYIVKNRGISFEDIEIMSGIISPNMMRQTSYITIVIPTIDRVVQVCDEEGNASYIFQLSKVDINQINTTTKEEKNEYIMNHPGIGIRIIQNPAWREIVEEFLFKEITTPKINKTEYSSTQKSESNVPQVEQGELHPWRGFWTDPEGRHWSTASALVEKLGRTNIVFYQRKEKQKDLETRMIRDIIGREQTGYCYEQFIELNPDLLIKRDPETKGEWEGFWTDPETGKHWGSGGTLMKKFGVTDWITIMRYVKKHHLPKKQIRDLAGRTTKGYAYEDFLELEDFIEFLTAPSVSNEGEWSGFWTDPEGRHWGTISSLANYFGISHKYTKDHTEGKMSSKNVRGLTGEVSQSFCLEDLQKNEKFMQFVNLPRVNSEGEWSGFWTDSEGRHWGNITQISRKLEIDWDKVKGTIKQHKQNLAEISVKDTAGIPRKSYCLEEIEKIL